MDKDQVSGRAEEIKEAAGKAVDNDWLKAEGAC